MLLWSVACLSGITDLTAPAAAFAQTQPPPATGDAEEPEEGPDESLSGQAIEVAPATEDPAIAGRLEDILRRLEDVGWVADPGVRVEEGIVTLRGVAESPDRRKLIGDLARNVEGVAIVINAMEVAPPDPLDLTRITATLRAWLTDAIAAIPYLLFAVVVLGLTFLAARLARRLARAFFGPRIENALLETVAVRAVAIAVGVVGVYLVLSVCGLTGLAAGVLGGAGLGGLVVGFAFRNIAENFLASVLLSMSQPFQAGDVVEIADELGVVQKVTTRGTWLMSLDGNHIQIPNGTVYTSVIRNLTANPNVRQTFIVGMDYADGVAVAQQVIDDALRSHPAVLTEPEPMVLLDELGASTVNLKVYFWCDGVANSGLKVRSSVIRRVKRAVEDAGLTMPDEAREVIFPKGVPLRGDLSGLQSDDDAAPPRRSDDPPAVRIETPAEPMVSAGEGDLASDTDELNDQARRSRDPDAAPDLLPDPPPNAPPAATDRT
ncbi:hypothetical protein LzC2_14960 [Planctomycetes bacterium LzC2]|uniref:BON domain-containing protein n=1 Tax=Alienimonas chondri TaxID=2681879 RepID=A0ABX1VEG0_9PLAN|nr:hypothetical protein [Alienimonas chondri]